MSFRQFGQAAYYLQIILHGHLQPGALNFDNDLLTAFKTCSMYLTDRSSRQWLTVKVGKYLVRMAQFMFQPAYDLLLQLKLIPYPVVFPVHR